MRGVGTERIIDNARLVRVHRAGPTVVIRAVVCTGRRNA